MAIACVYCNGSHANAAQARQCWADHDQPVVAASEPDLSAPQQPASPQVRRQPTTPSTPPRSATPRKRPSTTTEVVLGVAPAAAGPDALGRHAVVEPGQAASPPWSKASRITIDSAVLLRPTEAIAELRRAGARRERLVIEISDEVAGALGPANTGPAAATEAQPFEVGARFSFEVDELRHLLFANAIDLRPNTGADSSWILLDAAIAAGAKALTADARASATKASRSSSTNDGDAGAGDVITPTGKAVWLDGGPVGYVAPIDGVPVVPAASVEHGTFSVAASNGSDAELAPDQLAAVTHEGGAARIIAPAGSGKTRVLTERARHLLTEWQLPADAVSLVAFNKRAQEEMRERTTDLSGLQVRTLNAIGLAIVNGTPPFAPQPTRWRTIDEPNVRRIIGDLVSFPRRRNSDPVAPWIEALSLVRLGLIPPAVAERRYDGDVDGLAAMWPKYRATLEREGAVDFDDQIYRALLVLLTQPEARRVAQRACRVMLVDEFQDLTPAHLLLIRLLAAPGGAVFGVGDDDQTIYGYNGADPGWLIDFEQLFPGAESHPLEVNYRCPADIVDAVDRLLRHNQRRVPKTIRAAATVNTGSSKRPVGWEAWQSDDPVASTVDAVRGAIASGAPASDVAVLSRVNALLAPVQAALVSSGLTVSGGVGLEFLNRTAIRASLAWIRLATTGIGGPTRFNADDLREALLRPSRSFHPRITDWICEQSSVGELKRLAGRLNNEKDATRLEDFIKDIGDLQQLATDGGTTAQIVATVSDTVGLAGAVTTLDAHRRGMNRAAQGDDLTAMGHLAAMHDNPVTFAKWLGNQLAAERSPAGVVLATVHRVKGQEWPHVVVHLADADQYPHRLAEDVEEERRLFHVAITRASQHATIVSGANPSPFIDELSTEPPADLDTPAVATHAPEVVKSTSAPKKKGPTAEPTAGLDEAARARYDALCALRHDLRDGKPAYVVFDNKTAAAIASATPTTPSQLLAISGIGPAKVEKYGKAILSLLAGL